MQLISAQFLVFLPAVALFYYLIPNKFKYIWLFLTGICFYAAMDVWGLPVLAFTILTTYLAGRMLGSETVKNRKAVLFCAIGVNLLILALSKYTALTFLGAVGISFFMFMSISYCVDVYRGDLEAEKNLLKYALFISFFPNITSGPIERAGHMLPQFSNPRPFDYDRMRDGLLQMLWGYFMKLVIADRCAVLVSTVYGAPEKYAGTATLVASVFYTFEIYCDFGGYSNIAIGCARVLGYDLMKNFDSPYLSGSIAEFWRRWHISLSGWFKDYLYIPLGGNRKGTVRKYVNIIIVFILSGLWHGAGASFAIWGLLHGFYQVIGFGLKPVRDGLCRVLKIKRDGFSHRLMKIAVTFFLVDIAWIFFRVTDIKTALYMVGHFFKFTPWFLTDGSIYTLGLDRPNVILLMLSIAVLIITDIAGKRGISIREKLVGQEIWFRWIIYIAAIVLVVTCGIWGPGYDETGFIYVQF